MGAHTMKEISWDDALGITLTERQVRIATGQSRPKGMTRRELEHNFMEVFELVGGVPRLAFWANNPENYGEFIKIMARFVPKEMEKAGEGAKVVYVSSVPQSPLNDPKLPDQPVSGEFIPSDE